MNRSIITLLLIATKIYALAYDFKVDDIYYNIISLSPLSVEVTCGECKYSGTIVIPESVTYSLKSFEVSRIGVMSFNGSKELSSIVIPKTVTTIESYAFEECSSLKNLTIPASIKNIEAEAFRGCHFDNFVIEDSNNLLSFGTYSSGGIYTTFSQCDIDTLYLGRPYSSGYEMTFSCPKSVMFGPNVTELYERAFSGSKIESIVIPSTLKKIGVCAFSGCDNLKRIVIEDSESKLQIESLYYHMYSINSGSYIGWGYLPAFASSPLEEIYLGRDIDCNVSPFLNEYYDKYSRTLKSITLTELTIGSNVKKIYSNCFENCEKLSKLILPEGVCDLNNQAFMGCIGLKSIRLPNSLSTIGEDVFANCFSLDTVKVNSLSVLCNIQYGNKYSNPLTYAKHIVEKDTLVTNLVIPNTVSTIKKSLLEGLDWESVCCLSAVPPKLEDYNFTIAQYALLTLYVPKGCFDIYKNADNWNKFVTIEENVYGIYSVGDVNGDGVVNVVDVVELTNFLMGLPSNILNEKNADANDDGEINDADIMCIVNIILKNNKGTI